jgi:hypothetical protein
MLSVPSLVAALITKIKQGGQIAVGDDDDVPTLAAVTPVRSSLRHEFLTPEAHTAAATFTSGHKYFRLIDEH